MQPPRASSLPLLLLVAQLACTTVYVPTSEPLTEDGLADAIQTLQETESKVELLEDGLQLDVYVYEWRTLPAPPEVAFHSRRLSDSMFDEGRRARMLTGPRRGFYLPYAWIGSIEARSWPLWSGVEIEVAGLTEYELDGPVVLRAAGVEEAERLADAIDRIRQARLPTTADVAAGPPD